MKKQSFLSWVAVAILTFFITSCEDSLQLDSKADCADCAHLTPGIDKTGITPSSLTSDAWEQIADFPRRKYGAVSFTISEKFAFVGTGYTFNMTSPASVSRDFWNYNPSSNVWTQIADFGGQARAYATSFSIGGKGYVGTGHTDTGTTLKDFWEYDYPTNIWTQKADFEGEARLFAVGLAIGSKGYIGTGQSNSGYKKDFWEYNPLTNLWTQKADFGGVARALAGGFVIGKKAGYLGGGSSSSNYNQLDFWQYYPASNIWKRRASLGDNSNPRHSGFFAIGLKGYAGGNGQLWMYDSSIDSWVQKANFPLQISNGVGFSLWDQFGYIGGGYYTGGPDHGAFYKYIPD